MGRRFSQINAEKAKSKFLATNRLGFVLLLALGLFSYPENLRLSASHYSNVMNPSTSSAKRICLSKFLSIFPYASHLPCFCRLHKKPVQEVFAVLSIVLSRFYGLEIFSANPLYSQCTNVRLPHFLIRKHRLVQISLLKKGNLDSKKHLNGTFPNPKAQERHKKGLYRSGNSIHAPLIWTALSGASKNSLGNLALDKTQIFQIRK
jgi:hypothetical protein